MEKNIDILLLKYDSSRRELSRQTNIPISTLQAKITGRSDWRLCEMLKVVNYFNSFENKWTIEDVFFKTLL